MKTEHTQDKTKSALDEVYLVVILKLFLVPGFLNYGNCDFFHSREKAIFSLHI